MECVGHSRNGGRRAFQAGYGFSKVSSVSVVGGRPVGVGIDIVNMGGVCCDIDAEVFTVLMNRQIFSIQTTPGVYTVM
jgi:hypothetical protein